MSGISLKCEDINIYCKTNKTLESLEDFAKMFFHCCFEEKWKKKWKSTNEAESARLNCRDAKGIRKHAANLWCCCLIVKLKDVRVWILRLLLFFFPINCNCCKLNMIIREKRSHVVKIQLKFICGHC